MTTAKSQQFLNELAQFYRNKGQHNITPDDLIARLNGKQVNLCELYSSVIEMGGSYKVNQYAKWDDIYLRLFSPQPLASNVSVALRQIYQRYLLAYEKANYSNYISENVDDDDESTIKDSNLNLNFLTNNNQQLAIQQSTNLNPLNKLFCSLMSDLPNEMDFGLRVATILTNSEKIDNLADFKFVNVIIECCILYICSCERIDYSKSTDYKFEDEEFSNLNSKDELERVAKSVIDNLIENQDKNQINDLTLEHKENINSNRNTKSLSNKFNENNVCKFVPFKDCKCFVKFWCKMIQNDEIMKFIFDLSNTELLDLYDETYCEQEEHQKNYYKIKRITNLLKNLSYSIEKLRQDQNLDYEEYSKNLNDIYDSASINLLRFLILLLNSNDQSFINTALEILSNISPLVNSSLNNLVDQQTYIRLLVYIYDWCVDKVLNSLDVNYLNRSLEILAKLINSNHIAMNRLIISEIFDQTSIYKRLTELLTCQHDVGVVISALEFTLSLSENYPKSLLNDNKHLVKVLINLINCDEGQYFSKNSIKKIRIIDETQRMSHHLIMQQNHYQQPQTFYIHQNQPAITSNQKIIQLNDNQAILIDNEQHLKNWLYTNFEAKSINNNPVQQSKIRLKLNEIYNDYIKYSCLSGRRNVVTSQTFSNLLKKYFPSVVFINSSEIDGLIMKAGANKLNSINIIQQQQPQQLIQTHPQIIINSAPSATVSTTTANLTSPILKAHLSTPPKSNSSNQISNPSIINSNNQQPQLPNGPTTASPLIKNLLANKLRNNNQTSTINSNLNDSKSIVTTTNLLNQHQTVTNNSVLITTNSSQQHLLPNVTSNSMIINTNQLNTTPGTTGQILLVRTILPQQNNQNTGQTTNQQAMRLILPASVLTTCQSSLPQTINLINGTANLTQTSNTIVSTSQNLQNSLITTVANSSLTNKQSIDKQQSNDSNQLIKSVLRSPPTILVNNCANASENQSTIQQKPISNNVKSSPLLNVLLDKGKLPDYSTTASNDNAQDNIIIKNVSPQIVVSTQSSQLTNHIIANSSSSSSTIINTNSSLPNQIVATSTVNSTNPTKMYILTTTSKSPISIKNASSITTSSNSTPIQPFVIQQSTAPKTNSGIINQTNGQPTQFILQQSPTLINSQNNTVVISQPLIVQQQQQQPSTICTTIQNPKLDQSITSNNKDNEQQINNKLTNNILITENNITVNNIGCKDTVINCVVKKENGEINDKEIINKNSPISDKKLNTNEITSQILTNGCLEKDKIENMQIDEEHVKEIQQKDSLLKRQLESNDTFIKRPKNDSQLAIIPVQTATIKSESQLINKQQPILNNNQVNHNKKDDTITVVVSSNGLIPNQPTISNTLIKTALNSYIPKTNSTTCTIEKITIAKPNVVLNSNLNENIKLASVVVQQQQKHQPQKPKQNKLELEYICEWSNCKKSFSQPNQVFLHVHLDHINPLEESKSMKCVWGGPDGTGPGCKSLRPKYSLLTHLQDFHCGVQQLKQVAQRNQQLLTKGITDIPPIVPPAHPGYANNAAFLAIKRHSSNLIESKPIQNVGPLSKSVRLTAAMILRNLAQHSNSIKRLLKNYESYLSELCIFDSREDSRTLAQCLAIIAEEK